MGSMNIDIIKSKLESARALILEAAALSETESKGGDGWFLMEASSLKMVSTMAAMEQENIDRHERMMLSMNDPKEAEAILKEAERRAASTSFQIDDRIKDALKDLGVELSFNKIDPKDKLQ